MNVYRAFPVFSVFFALLYVVNASFNFAAHR